MKKIYILFISIFIFNQAFSQIKEKQVNISLGVQPCLSQDVQNIDNKETAKLWKKFFKQYGKVKKNSKAKEYYSTGIRVNRIKSGDPIDVYAKFVDFADGTNINLCFDLGTGFLSKKDTPNEYDGALEFLDEFVIYVERFVVEEKLKKEEKMLSKLEKSLKSVKKSNKKLHDKIDNYNKKITKAEEDIRQNVIEQEELDRQIQDQALKLKKVQRELENIGR